MSESNISSPSTHIGAIAKGYRKKRALEKRVGELRKALKSGEPGLLQSLQAIPSRAIAVGGVNIRIKTIKSRRRPKAPNALRAIQSLVEERDNDPENAASPADFAKQIFELCSKTEDVERETIAVEVDGSASESSDDENSE